MTGLKGKYKNKLDVKDEFRHYLNKLTPNIKKISVSKRADHHSKKMIHKNLH